MSEMAILRQLFPKNRRSGETASISKRSIQRHLRIHRSRPPVNAAAHGLRFLESLLPKPISDAQGTHAAMAHDNDAFVRVEFLMSTRRNVTHRDVLTTLQARGIVFPWFANIKQDKTFAAFLQRLHLAGTDF